MATIRVAGEQSAVLDWCAAQGIDPTEFSSRVDLNDDGTITLYRYLAGADGGRIIVDCNVCQTCGHGDGKQELATKPIVLTPIRPFPVKAAA